MDSCLLEDIIHALVTCSLSQVLMLLGFLLECFITGMFAQVVNDQSLGFMCIAHIWKGIS